jgi:hypothetical protein
MIMRRLLAFLIVAGIVAIVAWGPGRDNRSGSQTTPGQTGSQTVAKPGPSVVAQEKMIIGPAPAGDEAMVALAVIYENFDKAVCPLVTEAHRLGDGAIRATCDNGEAFLIFSASGVGPAALRCSVAWKLGIEC